MTQENTQNGSNRFNNPFLKIRATMATNVTLTKTVSDNPEKDGLDVATFRVCHNVEDRETFKQEAVFVDAKGWNAMAGAIESRLGVGDTVDLIVQPVFGEYENNDGAQVKTLHYVIRRFDKVRGSNRQRKLAEAEFNERLREVNTPIPMPQGSPFAPQAIQLPAGTQA